MKISVLCCTFRRAHLLGQMIQAFLEQAYPAHLRELLILADDGVTEPASGDGWQIISIPRRFATLGEKRSACAGLASPDATAFAIWDDDDAHLRWALSTHAEALANADWSRPSMVILDDGGDLHEARTGGLFQGGWAFRKELFHRVGGYRAFESNGEDQELAARFEQAGARITDPSELAPPSYIYRNASGAPHLSWMGPGHDGYRTLGRGEAKKEPVRIGWLRDYPNLPIKRLHPPVAPHVASSGPYRVDLIGPQLQGGRDGPSQGMFALQKALKGKADWLSIKAKPPTPGRVAWWWNWSDKGDFAQWDRAGHPSVIGPNVIFESSGTPGIDADERRVLNGRHIRAFFCHSAWYADLIRKHRTGSAPVFEWPYPIDPWPGEPEADRYDLLLYCKGGWRPALLEHLERAYPRHIRIEYGHYDRDQLFQAARRSRACAYLADDDHGPLALQEILLAGCPVIGVRTGASLITDGVSGLWVPRLCPGEQCVSNDQERADLALYLATLRRLLEFDRRAVRAEAARRFDTQAIADTVLGHLERIRRVQLDPAQVDQ